MDPCIGRLRGGPQDVAHDVAEELLLPCQLYLVPADKGSRIPIAVTR
jgi:hypothetical protein